MASILLALTDDAERASAAQALDALGWPIVVHAGSPRETRAAVRALQPPGVVVIDHAFLDADPALIQDIGRSVRRTSIVVVMSGLAVAPTDIQEVISRPIDPGLLASTVTGEVTRQIALELSGFVATVLAVHAHDPTPTGIVCGGTTGLVSLPDRRVLVTAKHVADRARSPGMRSLLTGTGPPLDITGWEIIASNEDLDLATIAIPDTFDPESIEKRCFTPRTWPPARAVRGDRAFFVGFAGIHRETVPGGVRQHAAVFYDFVSSASDRHFLLADEERVRAVSEFVRGLEPFGATGGMSGAPVFVNRDGEFDLSGVLYEGGDGPDATFFVAHAAHIAADGTIDWG